MQTNQADFVNPTIKYDAVSIEARAGLLPEPMREPFVWLMNYTREECNRDVDLLVEAFRAVGVYHDKTTWARIFKGRWQQDANGKALPSPIISSEKFGEAIMALRNNVRVEAIRGRVPFVETTTWKSISRFIDIRRRPERVNKFGIIIGPTGSQKTACFREYSRRNNHGVCTWLEAPENGSVKEFVTRLAKPFGIGMKAAYDYKRAELFKAVKSDRCIIVDNTQDLYKERLEHNQPAFAFLRRLQDETNCTIILSITPTFERVLIEGMMKGYFEQFEGRAGGRKNFLRLSEFAPDDDVLEIARKLDLREAGKHTKELIQIARKPGRIRYLFEVLQDAKLEAEAMQEKFTIDHVRAAAAED
jgi:DNA transposition AAA+ family ATPase